MIIGAFEVELLEPGKWRAKNTRTGFTHATYGTEEEVREQLEAQTAAWDRRLSDGKDHRMSSNNWRLQNKKTVEEVRRAKEKRKAG